MTVSLMCLAHATQERDLFLWSENFDSKANLALVKIALQKAAPKYGKINVKRTVDTDYEGAFSTLQEDTPGFDVLISALSKPREESLLPVYFPLDRGLLGFRICIVNQKALSQFSQISHNGDFQTLSLNVTLDPAWPDTVLMESNNIQVRLADSHKKRLDLVRNSANTCYSRSMIEIDNEIAQTPDLRVEKSFVMIYPQADILYFRKGAKEFAEALEYGLKQAYSDGSFLAVYDEQYSDIKMRYSLYDRKLLIMKNPLLSEKGREAVNRFGLFSFIQQPGK